VKGPERQLEEITSRCNTFSTNVGTLGGPESFFTSLDRALQLAAIYVRCSARPWPPLTSKTRGYLQSSARTPISAAVPFGSCFYQCDYDCGRAPPERGYALGIGLTMNERGLRDRWSETQQTDAAPGCRPWIPNNRRGLRRRRSVAVRCLLWFLVRRSHHSSRSGESAAERRFRRLIG
jgi:hypothetical protein